MKILRNKIKNWLLKDLLKTMVVGDVVTINAKTNEVFISGRKVEQAEAEAIREEAKFIEKTRIWALMLGTLNDQTRERLYEKAVTIDDMMFGKAMLYTLNIQNQILSIFKNIK
jgi:hypothetical protein